MVRSFGMAGPFNLGALVFVHMRRVHLDECGEVVANVYMLNDLHRRIRDVPAPADGYLYVCTDETDGRVLRLEPSSGSGAPGLRSIR